MLEQLRFSLPDFFLLKLFLEKEKRPHVMVSLHSFYFLGYMLVKMALLGRAFEDFCFACGRVVVESRRDDRWHVEIRISVVQFVFEEVQSLDRVHRNLV